MDGTRQAPLYQSLVRPHLLMGAERGATMLNAGIAILIYFLTMSVPGIIIAVLWFSIIQTILRLLAKSDHQLIEIVQRARKWQDFYADGATLDARYRDIPMQQKISPINKAISHFVTVKGGKKDEKHA
jgi:type IV secretion system protein VirB3